MLYFRFFIGSVRIILKGPRVYLAWMALLLALIGLGAYGYYQQYEHGLIVSNMRDQVSWGFYIGQFTFFVGIAAAAVVLVIPAYLYHWKPIKEISVIGELMAVAAIVICLLFVVVDLGRPERFWHLLPFVGHWHVPQSLLAWDALVLNLYLVINLTAATHILYRAFVGRPYSKRFALPLILFSIPLAISIHSVTAFLYNGMKARAFWNSAILAPRFIASAFCSGPAIMLVVLQILKRAKLLEIRQTAIWKIAEIMAWAMFINLFLFGAEIFTEWYSATEHLVHSEYLYFGIGSHRALVPYAWLSFGLSLFAFSLYVIPRFRKNVVLLNVGAVAIYASVYIEKGVALVLPGYTPSVLGDVYEYFPSRNELMVSAGIYSVGALVFTVMLKVAIHIMNGDFSSTSHLDRADKKRMDAVESTGGANCERQPMARS